MIKVEHTIFIDRPIPEVFDYLVDPSKQREWQEGVLEAGYSSGTSGPGEGAEAFEKRKFMGREMTSKFKVTRFIDDKLFVRKIIEGPMAFEVTYVFVTKAGGTEVTAVVQGEPGEFLKVAEGPMREQLESQLAADFERAKKILES